MANTVCELLSSQGELERTMGWPDASAGAVLDFRGVVREDEGGKTISGIEYEAHATMAEHQLRSIADAARDRFGLTSIILRHRLGFVPTGEASLYARVTAPHRQATLDAMAWLVDELKKKVPIWKHPHFVEAKQASAAEVTHA
jgi:molybdopterin synthase catalytic subunit